MNVERIVGPVNVPRWQSYLVPAILLVHTILLGYGAYIHSPTLNEPGHLVAGISYLEFGRFDVYDVNPPLIRMVAAVPVILSGAITDWHSFHSHLGARPEEAMGADFIAANGHSSFFRFTLARWACIPFSLLGGVICYRWASELYCFTGGLLALILWCFCPNILAHGQLITPDVAATSLGLAACYAFWHWLKRPSWGRTAISGVALGMAELSKMTLIVFFPLYLFMWLLYRLSERRSEYNHRWFRELTMLSVQVLIGVNVLNLGYEFDGTFTPLRDFHFQSSFLTVEDKDQGKSDNVFAHSWLGSLPVPLPKSYVLGIDQQKKDLEDVRRLSYLRGEFRDRGWWYYYLYAMAIKVPLGNWLLLFLAIAFGARENLATHRRDEFVLLFPAITVVLLISSQTGFNEHLRYVLPAFPFVFVWIGRLSAVFQRQQRLLLFTAVAALVWSVVSSLWIYPHSLSYFNELAGGPTGGPAHLISSNVDWGQDLLILKRWLDQHTEARPLKLAYFGYFDPRYAGIEYSALVDCPAKNQWHIANKKFPPGWYAISVNFIRGFPHSAYCGDGSRIAFKQDALAAFQQWKPVAMAGYSIYIYHVPGEQ